LQRFQWRIVEAVSDHEGPRRTHGDLQSFSKIAMICQLFLISALALPPLSVNTGNHEPGFFKDLVKFLVASDPVFIHQRERWELYLQKDSVALVRNVQEYPILVDEIELPFYNEQFFFVVKMVPQLGRSSIKEIRRVMEYGGYFLIPTFGYQLLLQGYNFSLLPFKWQEYYIYQKRGSPRNGNRYRKGIERSA